MSILLFADDIVLTGETEQELQIIINELHVWCKTWHMKVNCEKTQIVHFRPKKQPKQYLIFVCEMKKSNLQTNIDIWDVY